MDVKQGITEDVSFDKFKKLVDDINQNLITIVITDSLIVFHKSTYTIGANSSLGTYIHVSGTGFQATLANPDKYMYTIPETYDILKENNLLGEVIHNLKLKLLAQI